jgi:8-oxo-dGTP pyrophosphatase MutT (NUDIX family)
VVDAAWRWRYPIQPVPTRFDLQTIREKLADRPAVRQERPDVQRRAAVATILRPAGDDTEVLLIRRAERLNDPWSGHMAFPGGHHDPTDPDLLATAVREAREEVGLDLAQHEYLGQLDELPAIARGRFVGMIIAPYVFAVRGAPLLTPNDEVAELVWGRLGQMASGAIDDVKELTHEGELRRLPAYRVQGNIVWGMTHYMLQSLFSAIG